mmetsp:Transcript_130897/g.418953  ORF Transcript_130897/g.418953 Transcript_130897/m.418953 type:complete len:267 (+) Transcript_130897:4871-5671(+)
MKVLQSPPRGSIREMAASGAIARGAQPRRPMRPCHIQQRMTAKVFDKSQAGAKYTLALCLDLPGLPLVPNELPPKVEGRRLQVVSGSGRQGAGQSAAHQDPAQGKLGRRVRRRGGQQCLQWVAKQVGRGIANRWRSWCRGPNAGTTSGVLQQAVLSTAAAVQGRCRLTHEQTWVAASGYTDLHLVHVVVQVCHLPQRGLHVPAGVAGVQRCRRTGHGLFTSRVVLRGSRCEHPSFSQHLPKCSTLALARFQLLLHDCHVNTVFSDS